MIVFADVVEKIIFLDAQNRSVCAWHFTCTCSTTRDINSFAQEICTTNGEVITIQVVTSQGQQLFTELSAEGDTTSPANIAHHLNHCPFCTNPNTSNAIQVPYAPGG